MRLDLFLAYCDVDPNKLCFICKCCGTAYSLIELVECYNLSELYVRDFNICPYEDSFELMITFRTNEVSWDE